VTGPALTGPALTGLVVPVAVLAVVAWYALAVRRLRSRGDRWPRSRAAAAAVAAGFALAAAAVPATAGFTGHTLRHLLLTMAAPVALALAAPVSLALRTASPRVRAGLLRVVRSRPAGVLGRAPVVVAVAASGPWLLYLTPLYAWAHHRPWLQLLAETHLVLGGCLLAWYLAARDPQPHRPSTRTTVVVLLLTAGSHDVLAKLMYAHALPAHGGSPAAVRAGAELMYYGGDLVTVALAVVVLARWYTRAGRRAAGRVVTATG
jgi:putative membrane protein